MKMGIQCQKISNKLDLIFRNKCFSVNLMFSAMFSALDSHFHGNDVVVSFGGAVPSGIIAFCL
jgi:hypothetical protein